MYLKEEQSLIIKSDSDASPGSIHMESDEEVINFHFQKRFEELEELLSDELSERHARLEEVDMEAYDYSDGKRIIHEEEPEPSEKSEKLEESSKNLTADDPSLNDETDQALLMDQEIPLDNGETEVITHDESGENVTT
jgi:hypothetical protein